MTLTSHARREAVPLVAALAILVACSDHHVVTGPGAPSPSVSLVQLDRPFYYYQGSPLYLDVDSAGFIISSEADDPASAVGEALSGLEVVQLSRLTQLRDHWIVRLPAHINSGVYRAALTRLRASSRIRFASSLYRSPGSGTVQTLLDRLAVRFKAGTARSSIDSLVAALRSRIKRQPRPDSGVFYHLLAYPRDRDPLEFAATLYRHPLVEWADPDMIADIRRSAPEPYFDRQYYLSNTAVLNGAHVDINVLPVWTVTVGTWNVKVVVVDDGIDGNHFDLWCGPPVVWAYDAFLNQFPDTPLLPYPTDRHGTAVAGILHGCHDGSGIAGVAPGTSLGVVRIFRNDSAASGEAIAAGINWAWSIAGADVISNSWTCNSSTDPTGCAHHLVTDAINNAATLGRGGKGTVVVFSAGNTSDRAHQFVGGVSWPAILPNVIAVGAIDRDGLLTNYTPEGPQLDIVAPSGRYVPQSEACADSVGDVVTADRWGSYGCNDGPNGDVNYSNHFTGTSAAAPQVAGAAALILTLSPNLTRLQVTALLLNNANSWGAANQYGAGKLNIWASATTLLPPPFSVSLTGANPVRPYSHCLFTANSEHGTEPFSYTWTADGVPVGDDSPLYRHGAGTSAFQLGVTVTDGQGRLAVNSLSVSVDPFAQECNDQ